MGYARIFARAVSNPGFDGINTMPFTTLLSAHHSAICADSRVVLKGIIFMSSEVFCSPTQGHATIPNKRRTALRAANWGQWGVASAVLWHNLIFQAPLTPNFRQAAHPDGLGRRRFGQAAVKAHITGRCSSGPHRDTSRGHWHRAALIVEPSGDVSSQAGETAVLGPIRHHESIHEDSLQKLHCGRQCSLSLRCAPSPLDGWRRDPMSCAAEPGRLRGDSGGDPKQ